MTKKDNTLFKSCQILKFENKVSWLKQNGEEELGGEAFPNLFI
jgi:hypothetical protein